MALDKTAPERLRLERGPDEGKYRQRGGSRRWLWYVLGAVAVLAAVLAWRAFHSAVPVQPAITGLARIRRGMTNATSRG
jgi:hypothetical protein